MRKRMFTITALLALSLMTSACWNIAAARINPNISEFGKITIDLRPYGSTSTLNEHAFVLVGYSNIDPRVGRVFDKDGNFGGPYDGVKDGTLRAALLGGASTCEIAGVNVSEFSGSATRWEAYRSPGTINQALSDGRMMFQHGVKKPGGAGAGSIGVVTVFSGMWSDDGDSIPEAAELICGGMSILSTNY